MGQGVLEALGADLAARADLLGLAGGTALLGKERLGVGLGAQSALLPGQLAVVGGVQHWHQLKFLHGPS